MFKFKPDCSGYATRYDIRCRDGRTIRNGAFQQDGEIVPVVYNHQHNDSQQVLGHALLEARDDGMYAYISFNNTQNAQDAKEQVAHGDITHLSIYANDLQHSSNRDVLHGTIREVSLVLAGANEGALIDYPVLAHSGEEVDTRAIIWSDEDLCPLELWHSEDYEGEEIMGPEEIYDNMLPEEQDLVDALVDQAYSDGHDDGYNYGAEDGYADGYDDGAEDGYADGYDDGEYYEEDAYDDEYEGEEEMHHNLFYNEPAYADDTLMHADFDTMMNGAKAMGSVQAYLDSEDAVIQHDGMTGSNWGSQADYGIVNIDYMFDDYHLLDNQPRRISRKMEWVSSVINGTHKTPFARIKSLFADITEDEARAKGYIKGKLKKEEVFGLLKRETSPTTVYKKQKFDREDIVQVNSFDVIAWVKNEMDDMLQEEVARAILVGDGRSAADNDKINEACIRPIWTDADLFSIKIPVEVLATDDETARAKKFIRACIKGRKQYRGTGRPDLYTTEDMLTDMLLITDLNGRDIYDSEEKLRTKLRVNAIHTVPVMENLSRTVTEDDKAVTLELGGIIVNLSDYNVGVDKLGKKTMFEDFDIDFNQMKYLIETMMSGAMIQPFGAMIMEFKTVAA